MKETKQILVNRMVGKVPLVGSFGPVQLGAAITGLFLGIIIYSNTENLIYSVAAALWVFFTVVLVLGKYYWNYINKYRNQAPWSKERLEFQNPLEKGPKSNGKKTKKKER